MGYSTFFCCSFGYSSCYFVVEWILEFFEEYSVYFKKYLDYYKQILYVKIKNYVSLEEGIMKTTIKFPKKKQNEKSIKNIIDHYQDIYKTKPEIYIRHKNK